MKAGRGISDNQRMGSVGESFIEGILKNFSQVLRPSILQDYALDFFCKLYDGRTPSNEGFYIQAKTTKSLGSVWKQSIPRHIIEFWLAQVYPAYVIVYDESTKNCFWISVEDNREEWISKFRNGNKTITVKVNSSNKFDETSFVLKVHKDGIRVKANHGIPVFVSKGYVGVIPYIKLSDNSRTLVRQTVRLGFDYLIYDNIIGNNFQEAYELCKLLTTFDLGHYDHFLLMARICKQLGKRQEALDNYDLAIKICKSDPNWNKRKLPSDPYIEDIIRMIEEEKGQLRDGTAIA